MSDTIPLHTTGKIHISELEARSSGIGFVSPSIEAWKKTSELKFVSQPDGSRMLYQAIVEIYSGRIQWQPVPEEILDEQPTNGIQS